MSPQAARPAETASASPGGTALTALTGEDRLRAIARQSLDRKVESLTELLDTDCSYVGVLDERREYFVGTHDFVLTALDVSLTPDRSFLTSCRGLRVSFHAPAGSPAEGAPVTLAERLEWSTSAAVRLPWLRHDPAVIVGTARRSSSCFAAEDFICLRQWARQLQRHMIQEHSVPPETRTA